MLDGEDLSSTIEGMIHYVIDTEVEDAFAGADHCDDPEKLAQINAKFEGVYYPKGAFAPQPGLSRDEAKEQLYPLFRQTYAAREQEFGAERMREIERIILLHDLTNTQLCRMAAADMVRRGCRGHILNMSSYSLWMPFPGLTLYSASKAYLKCFSVAFAKEVREAGIRVTAVCPAGVATDLYGLTPRWQRIGLRMGVLISADCCARRGLWALWHGQRCTVPDWWNRLWIPLCKLLPMCLIRPIRRFTMKFQK